MDDMAMQSAYSDGEPDANLTEKRDLGNIVSERLSRRQTSSGALSASAMAFFGTSMLSGCFEGAGGAALAQPGSVTTASSGQTLIAADLYCDTIIRRWERYILW